MNSSTRVKLDLDPTTIEEPEVSSSITPAITITTFLYPSNKSRRETCSKDFNTERPKVLAGQ
jgi:hypothetical protein